MTTKKNIISQEWYEKIVSEINNIKDVQIPETLEVLKDARSQGDLSENSDYHSAKEKLSLLQRRILELEWLIDKVEIATDEWDTNTSLIRYGSKVTLEVEWDEPFTVSIVGAGEVAVLEALNISFESPLWIAIEGKQAGDVVELKLANTNKKVKILSVS
jgi:transcription elongation factor GreA